MTEIQYDQIAIIFYYGQPVCIFLVYEMKILMNFNLLVLGAQKELCAQIFCGEISGEIVFRFWFFLYYKLSVIPDNQLPILQKSLKIVFVGWCRWVFSIFANFGGSYLGQYLELCKKKPHFRAFQENRFQMHICSSETKKF